MEDIQKWWPLFSGTVGSSQEQEQQAGARKRAPITGSCLLLVLLPLAPIHWVLHNYYLRPRQ